MQQAIIGRSYTFEAAHFLPGVPDGHKCKRVHGHNYRIRVIVSGDVDEKTGFVVDFFHLDKIVMPLIQKVDHQLLNDIEGLENPTAEIIAQWFANALIYIRGLGGLTSLKVRVYETDNAYAEVVLKTREPT